MGLPSQPKSDPTSESLWSRLPPDARLAVRYHAFAKLYHWPPEVVDAQPFRILEDELLLAGYDAELEEQRFEERKEDGSGSGKTVKRQDVKGYYAQLQRFREQQSGEQ